NEVRRAAGEQAETSVLQHAVAAANELRSRSGIDPQIAEQVSYVLPYLLEKLGRNIDAANAFLDYAQHSAQIDRANAALDGAQAIIGKLRKENAQDENVRKA